jgi:prevent-host-death family protein
MPPTKPSVPFAPVAEMAAGRFKATCLEVMDEIAARGTEVVVTKRGRPVVRVVPVHDTPPSPVGFMRGTLRIDGDIVSSMVDEWTPSPTDPLHDAPFQYPKTGRARAARVAEPRSIRPPSSCWRASLEPARDAALLLDTHAWLWTLEGLDGTLSDAARALLARASAHGRLFVSDVSFWEASLLFARGRAVPPTDPALWLERAAQAPGLQPLPVTRDVFVRSNQLPGAWHADPADRLLLAQAERAGLTLLTCDRALIALAQHAEALAVCDGR